MALRQVLAESAGQPTGAGGYGGKYEWRSEALNNRDADDVVSDAITKYSWSDGTNAIITIRRARQRTELLYIL